MEEEVEKDESEMRKGKRNLIINIVLMSIIILLIVILLLSKYVLTVMFVSGESMEPTLHNKQAVLMHHTKDVSKGDIVVFEHSNKLVVKRVIATAGDSVKIDENGFVYLNGERLDEDYIKDGAPIIGALTWDITVGEGEIFVLGDNRNNSLDSEDYGTIKIDTIKGKLI